MDKEQAKTSPLTTRGRTIITKMWPNRLMILAFLLCSTVESFSLAPASGIVSQIHSSTKLNMFDFLKPKEPEEEEPIVSIFVGVQN
jgi:hypothetical protein